VALDFKDMAMLVIPRFVLRVASKQARQHAPCCGTKLWILTQQAYIACLRGFVEIRSGFHIKEKHHAFCCLCCWAVVANFACRFHGLLVSLFSINLLLTRRETESLCTFAMAKNCWPAFDFEPSHLEIDLNRNEIDTHLLKSRSLLFLLYKCTETILYENKSVTIVCFKINYIYLQNGNCPG
jgi:hypothetical protein